MAYPILLPRADGTCFSYIPGTASTFPTTAAPAQSRVAFAAAHVVCNPLADNSPNAPTQLDWEATLAYRHHLWSLGMAVAEAMDTAQRGMGLDWSVTQELIRRSVREARTRSARIACGAGTDHLPPSAKVTLTDVYNAYIDQCSFIEGEGGRLIVMASRALAACARSADDYAQVYDRLLSQVAEPVILHWLGPMFDPALAGYWGNDDLENAMEVCLDLIRRHAYKIDGIKISLLDAEHEITMRHRLPAGVRMYTGDDFNFAELIMGNAQGYSDALLGIFDAIAPAAAAAFQALDVGDHECYHEILAPTVPLSRHIFQAPTYYYKTGIVFLAYLNGHQSHFRMVAGLESARSIIHLSELFVLADKAGLLVDSDLATRRMRPILATSGIFQEGGHA